MKSRKEVLEFLANLQWKRFNKVGLELELSNFFGVPMKLTDGTCEDYKGVDYSFLTTTAQEELATSNFIDMEIYYLKMRKKGHFLITETTLLDYVD